jgi:pseudouridine kinase
MRKVTVIGGANFDIKGRSYVPLERYTSNPGYVSLSSGGVGRNIAHNLSQLGISVLLLTVLGKDEQGKRVLEETKKAGVNMEHIKISQEKPTGIYLAILDDKGDMYIALSSMDILEELNVEYLEEKKEIIKESEIVVIDANPPMESIEYILNFCKSFNITTVIAPVSFEKAKKLKNFLSNIDYIIPNRKELEALSGIEIVRDSEMKRAVKILREKGIKNVIVTLRERGVYISTEKMEKFLSPYKGEIVDTTGAGDALTAGFVYGIYNKYSIEISVKFGLASAMITIQSPYSVSPFLKEDILKRIVLEEKR